jgi:hypothetical protein
MNVNPNVVLKPRNKKPHLNHKRIRVHNLSKGIPLEVLEQRIEEMAELENAMTLYEHNVEAG